MCIAFLTQDLIFQAKVNSFARSVGLDCKADRTIDRLMARCSVPNEIRLWIIDLTLPIQDLIQIVASIKGFAPQAKLAAYAPHVHEARLEAARQAGVDFVFTRGQFDHQLATVIESLVVEPKT